MPFIAADLLEEHPVGLEFLPFDGNNLGPMISQDHRTVWTRQQSRQIENPDSGQGPL